MLRHSVPEAVEDPGVHRVPEVAERLQEPGEYSALVPDGKVGDVLDEDRLGAKPLHDRHERPPELRTGISVHAHTATGELAQARAARA